MVTHCVRDACTAQGRLGSHLSVLHHFSVQLGMRSHEGREARREAPCSRDNGIGHLQVQAQGGRARNAGASAGDEPVVAKLGCGVFCKVGKLHLRAHKRGIVDAWEGAAKPESFVCMYMG